MNVWTRANQQMNVISILHSLINYNTPFGSLKHKNYNFPAPLLYWLSLIQVDWCVLKCPYDYWVHFQIIPEIFWDIFLLPLTRCLECDEFINLLVSANQNRNKELGPVSICKWLTLTISGDGSIRAVILNKGQMFVFN